MPNLRPLRQFYCDECGKIIESADDGAVEYLYSPGEGAEPTEIWGFRIVHNILASPKDSCSYDEGHYLSVSGESTSSVELNLARYLDHQGVSRLLAILEACRSGVMQFKEKKDFGEFLDVFRRLQIPYYEEARLLLEEDDKITGPLVSDDLKFIVESDSSHSSTRM